MDSELDVLPDDVKIILDENVTGYSVWCFEIGVYTIYNNDEVLSFQNPNTR